ncbi:MAG: MucB/RseB C-terminal domain-containing protein [Neisseriaceae bacterium]|nr:MucB/RseB C-terminal domain-containing protein [Neisseriaceae bacterium]
MKKFILSYLVLLPSVPFAEDAWRALDQISFSAVAANFIGTMQVSSDDKQLSEQYRVFFREDDGDTTMKIVSSGQPNGEIIKTDSNVRLYSDTKEGLLKLHFLNFNRYPNFLPSNPSILKSSYSLDLGAKDRVADKSCQWYWLSPKTNKDYYSVGFCADKKNYFPLTYVYKDPNTGEEVEKIRFSDISYESPSDSQLQLQKKYKLNNTVNNPMSFSRKMNRNGQVNDDFIKNLPEDFYIISEKNSSNKNFRYYYLSNGLVYMSLFVHPVKKSTDIQKSKIEIKQANIYGPINQMEYTDSQYKIVLVGDMPFKAMKQFISDTSFKD